MAEIFQNQKEMRLFTEERYGESDSKMIFIKRYYGQSQIPSTSYAYDMISKIFREEIYYNEQSHKHGLCKLNYGHVKICAFFINDKLEGESFYDDNLDETF